MGRPTGWRTPLADLSTLVQCRSAHRSADCDATPRLRRIHETFPWGSRSGRGPSGFIDGPRSGFRRSVGVRELAGLGWHQHAVGVPRGRAGDLHAARVHVPGDRILPGQERGHDRREDLDELLDRRDHVLGGGLRVRLRRSPRARHRRHGILPPRLRRSVDGVPDHGLLRRVRRVEVHLPVRVLRRVARDRLGHHARADQVRRLRHLRRHLLRADLPDLLGLGLRRRLAAERHRHAGLRRLDGRPPHRRHRWPGGAAAARCPQGQVRPDGKPRAIPGHNMPPVRPQRRHPAHRLVRVQPRLDAERARHPLRGGRARDAARRPEPACSAPSPRRISSPRRSTSAWPATA